MQTPILQAAPRSGRLIGSRGDKANQDQNRRLKTYNNPIVVFGI